jgi:hypothetical protein
MTRPAKAALLSALVFPGLGHIVLKLYLRGSILMLGALASAWVIVRIAFRQAQAILDGVASGDIPIESGAITEVLSKTSADSDSTAATTATVVFTVCWLIGIIDSYRAGVE